MANSPARMLVDVGSVIADTYTLEALLGRGGMGAVFLASHKRLAGKRVAIKILHTELDDADVVARFKREAEIAARLNHPNIVGVIDYNVAPDGMPYLVLDYLEGETLAQRIARGPMPTSQVLSIARQIGSALAAAHRAGIVHRDLKPQNVFLVPTEVDGRHVEIAKVLDFGISKILGSQTVKTQDSTLLGTPQYMAPEQATGQHANVDERTDVFALGAIVYEMLCGRPAFSGASIPEVVFKVVYEEPPALAPQVPSLSPAIAGAVARAMAKSSDQRFASVTDFVEALTGQPLTLPRGQATAPAAATESPSAARRVASGEAFAQTMGSGDHGDSPVQPLGATVAPHAADAPRATAPTPDPARSARATPALVPPVSTASGVEPPRRRRPRRRAAGRLVALVVAAVAIRGAYVAMRKPPRQDHAHRARPNDAPERPDLRADEAPPPTTPTTDPQRSPGGESKSGGEPDSTEPTSVDPKPADPKSTDSRSTDSTPADSSAPAGSSHTDKPSEPKGDARHAGSATPGSGKPDAKGHAKPDPKTGAHPTPPPAPPTDDDVEGDEGVRQKLKEAAAALERREYDTAERLANAVIHSPGSPRQHASARLIHGSVQCAARNDQEAAGIDLRSLERFRVLRAKLLAVCRSHGVLTAP
jgi:serine/threonine-protein kinase